MSQIISHVSHTICIYCSPCIIKKHHPCNSMLTSLLQVFFPTILHIPVPVTTPVERTNTQTLADTAAECSLSLLTFRFIKMSQNAHSVTYTHTEIHTHTLLFICEHMHTARLIPFEFFKVVTSL